MAKHDRDPVLSELVRSVNETAQSAVPVTVTVRGSVLHGSLIADERYFTELAEGNPLLRALDPRAGLLGDGYGKDVAAESGRYLHMRAVRLAGDKAAGGLWRVALDAVDAWTLRSFEEAAGEHDKGPFARLLGAA
jgi:hypothetical protein